MRKPVVGETLYLVWMGDRRYRRDNREVTVTKVGRKYFEVSGESCQFFISTWMENYQYGGADWKVWENKESYEEYKELESLNYTFKSFFDGWGKPKITLDQARRIKAILDENKQNQQLGAYIMIVNINLPISSKKHYSKGDILVTKRKDGSGGLYYYQIVYYPCPESLYGLLYLNLMDFDKRFITNSPSRCVDALLREINTLEIVDVIKAEEVLITKTNK